MLNASLIDASRAPHRPGDQTNTLGLLLQLTELGVTGLPDTDRLIALQLGQSTPEPLFNGNVLDATDDELAAFVEQHALWQVRQRTDERNLYSAETEASRKLYRLAQAEAYDMVREQADDIVAQLEALWRPHVETARALVVAGCQPGDDAERMLTRPGTVQEQWLGFRSTGAPALTRIAEARLNLSQIARVAPYNSDLVALPQPIDYGLALTIPWERGAFDPARYRGESDVATWLRLANVLGMPAPSSIDDLSQAKAQGFDADVLRAEALAQD